jgi:hypothetical protein
LAILSDGPERSNKGMKNNFLLMINFRSLFIQIPEKKISTSKTFQNTLPRLIFFGTKLCLILAKKHKENVNKDLIGSRELKCQSK